MFFAIQYLTRLTHFLQNEEPRNTHRESLGISGNFHEMPRMERESNCSCGHFCSASSWEPDCFRVATAPPTPATQTSSRETRGRNQRRAQSRLIIASPTTTSLDATRTRGDRTAPDGSDGGEQVGSDRHSRSWENGRGVPQATTPPCRR